MMFCRLQNLFFWFITHHISSAAATEGTVYFSAPLYRKNLHYSVLPKPSSSTKVLEMMSDYILKNHKNDSGIVYCLAKKVCSALCVILHVVEFKFLGRRKCCRRTVFIQSRSDQDRCLPCGCAGFSERKFTCTVARGAYQGCLCYNR
jgi:hypothetical protein